MEASDLAQLLVTIGCPPEKSPEMASQLIKRAHQLAERKKKTFEQALVYLLDLMRKGWSAKQTGL